MKKLLFILSFLIAFNSYSQNNNGIEICLQYQKSLKSFISDKEAEDALNKILNVIGVSKNFLLVPCDEISNALAITFKGERYILYDKDFINKIEDMTNDWSGLFILAHEIGHHINGHSLDMLLYATEVVEPETLYKQREQELQADEFAGFILARLGAKFNEISELLDLIGNDSYDSYSTHPHKDKRIVAAKKGFKKGEVKKGILDDKTIKPEVSGNSSIKGDGEPMFEAYEGWYIPLEYGKVFGWDFFTHSSLEEHISYSERRIRRKLDPFEIADIKNTFPVKTKYSSLKGESFRVGNEIENLDLLITQEKYTYKSGQINEEFGVVHLDEDWQRHFPYTDIKIELKNFKEMPKIIDYNNGINKKEYDPENKEYAENNYKDNRFRVKFHYMIDDKIRGFCVAELKGWVQNVSYPDAIGGELRPDGSYGRVVLGNPVLNGYYPEDIRLEFLHKGNSYDIKNLVEFLNGIKKGKKLYLKMGDVSGEGFSNEWTYDSTLERHTYVFDLTGSSKALSFDKVSNPK